MFYEVDDMSEYAEERANMMGFNDIYEEERVKYWTMKDGTKIKISDMSESHLDHTVKMLERKYGDISLSRYAPYKALKEEQKKRNNKKQYAETNF